MFTKHLYQQIEKKESIKFILSLPLILGMIILRIFNGQNHK